MNKILHLKHLIRVVSLNVYRIVSILGSDGFNHLIWSWLVAEALANANPEYAEGVLCILAKILGLIDNGSKGEEFWVSLRNIQSTPGLHQLVKLLSILWRYHLHGFDLGPLRKSLSLIDPMYLHILKLAIDQPEVHLEGVLKATIFLTGTRE
jgi:hypothetical protein